MTRFPYDLIGFDLDGTLVDSVADLAAAANHALSSDGRPTLAIEQVRPMIGAGNRAMLARALEATGGCDEATLDRLLPVQIAWYADHIADATRPFPNVEPALDALAARGVRLAVMTNKLEHLAVALLEKLGLRERFVAVVGGDTVPGRTKPDPAPILEMVRRGGGGRAAFVGDSIYDVRGAQAAGLRCALYLPHGGDALGADTTFDDYAELVSALERMAG